MNGKSFAIQFIGTQRSGSNLLRVMLNQLPEISAPHPPHILKTFFPLMPRYGDIKNVDNFNLLVSDICEWVENNPVPWENFELNPREIAALCKSRTLIEVFRSIYEKKAGSDGAKYWCCKSMESIYYAKEIESSGIHPFYIYLYRDGRDVALSFKKAVVGPKHTYNLASKWNAEQAMSLNFLAGLPSNRFISIRYEDLISRPRELINTICDKLDIPFSEKVFDFFKSKESENTANSGFMWKNVAVPIISNNFNKFEKEFSNKDLLLFEMIAGEMLHKLGYHTKFWPRIFNRNFTNDEIQEFNLLDRQLREEALINADEIELSKRKPQESILLKINSRNRIVV